MEVVAAVASWVEVVADTAAVASWVEVMAVEEMAASQEGPVAEMVGMEGEVVRGACRKW